MNRPVAAVLLVNLGVLVATSQARYELRGQSELIAVSLSPETPELPLSGTVAMTPRDATADGSLQVVLDGVSWEADSLTLQLYDLAGDPTVVIGTAVVEGVDEPTQFLRVIDVPFAVTVDTAFDLLVVATGEGKFEGVGSVLVVAEVIGSKPKDALLEVVLD